MTGDDTLLLVVPCGVTGQFEDLSSEVFENGRKVDCIVEISSTRPSKLIRTYQVHRHRLAARSCPSSTDGGHDRQGTGGQPWPSAIGTCLWHRRTPCRTWICRCLCQTCRVLSARWLSEGRGGQRVVDGGKDEQVASVCAASLIYLGAGRSRRGRGRVNENKQTRRVRDAHHVKVSTRPSSRVTT